MFPHCICAVIYFQVIYLGTKYTNKKNDFIKTEIYFTSGLNAKTSTPIHFHVGNRNKANQFTSWVKKETNSAQKLGVEYLFRKWKLDLETELWLR